MKLKAFILILVLASAGSALIPQFYQTAEVMPGESSATVNLAPGYYELCFFQCNYATGSHLGFSSRHTFKCDTQLAFITHVGGFLGNEEGMVTLSQEPEIGLSPYAAAGFQVEFLEKPSLASQLTAELPMILSLGLLLGINSRKLKREVVTIGVKSLFYLPGMAYVNIHPLPRLHISLGAIMIPMLGGELHAGVGYTFGQLNIDPQSKIRMNQP